MSFATITDRLERLKTGLPSTYFRYVVFEKTREGLVPTVDDVAGRWDVCGTPFYVVPGQKNGVYAYRESHLKYTIIGDALVAGGTVNAGDHVTYFVQRMRPDKVIAMTHWTYYFENVDMEYVRYSKPCNFEIVDEDPDLNNVARFQHKRCEERPGRVPLFPTMASTFEKEDMCFAYAMTRYLVSGVRTAGGSRKKKRVPSGGAVPPRYKTETPMSPEFLRFVRNTLLQQVASVRSDYEQSTLMYDTINSLGARANLRLVVLHDFVGNLRHKFIIDVKLVLMACYAHRHLGQETEYLLTTREKNAHIQYMDAIKSIPSD